MAHLRSACGAPPQGGAASGPAQPDPRRPLEGAVRVAPAGIPHRTPWHPGRFLARHYLTPLGLSQVQAARLLGLSRRRLHEVLHGQRAMTPDTAVRCAIVFHTDASFWLALQSAWDSFHAWQGLRQQVTAPAALRAPLSSATR